MRSSFDLTSFALLCLLQRLSIADGHLRHSGHPYDHRHDDNYHHDDNHHHQQHQHHHHLHHGHRHLNADGQLEEHPDIFDSCMVLCYSDVVHRYGVEFAEKLQSEGFKFEACPDDGNSTTTDRALGATDQPERQWNIPELRGVDGKQLIPYIIESHPTFDLHNTYDTIAAAIDHIEKETGVLKFIPRTTESNYIFFAWDTLSNGNSCAAHVGRQDTFSKVFLGWCVKPMHKGNIIHETLHSLGFWHEHSRPDRDDYVEFRKENLQSPSFEANFQKSFRVNSLGSPYDFASIMHYPKNAFSLQPYNSAYDTLVPKINLLPGQVMGQRVGLSEHDVNQLRLLHQCSTGPRSGDIGINELCSPECKCWEFAGECRSDDECLGDLVCADTPENYSSQQDVVTDSLPSADVSWGAVTIECDRFCHQRCCQFPNNEAQCPLTCGSQSSRRRLNTAQVPSKMCLSVPDTNGSTSTTTQATTTTTTTTTTSTQAATTTSNNAKWYIDWSISRCVQSCNGPAPCGGEGQWVALHDSMEICCNSHLAWMSSVKSRTYEGCHIIPDGPAPPTNPPTPLPTKSPVSKSPSVSPTHPPTKAPVTPPPTSASSKSPSKGPTRIPTKQPTNAPTTGGPTSSPTNPVPTTMPTPNPTQLPTFAPTNIPTSPPTTGQPSKSPTSNPTLKPTTRAPSKHPTSKPTPTPTENNIIMYSGQFYVDWAVDGGRCVQDCDGPRPCGGKRDPWESSFPTESVCCSTMSYKPYNQCTYKLLPSTLAPITPQTTPVGTPTRQPTNKPTALVDTRWYPGESKCMNDGQAPSWQNNKYSSQATCCTSHFSWGYNECMGIKETGSGKWYVNWGLSKCVQDCEKSLGGSCGGLVPGSWILKHSSASACCTAHMSFATIAECTYTN